MRKIDQRLNSQIETILIFSVFPLGVFLKSYVNLFKIAMGFLTSYCKIPYYTSILGVI